MEEVYKNIKKRRLELGMTQIEDKAGLPHVSIHDLRHTFASMLNNAGVDIAMISHELGHSGIAITLNTYTHVFGNVSNSSRGIADSLNSRFEKQIEPASTLPLDEIEKPLKISG